MTGRAGDAQSADSENKTSGRPIAAGLLNLTSGPDNVPPGDINGLSSQTDTIKSFPDHGDLEKAVQDLRGASSPVERAAAARSLGEAGDGLGNVRLIAALFDESAEVREAAQEALARLGDPALANGSQRAVVDVTSEVDTQLSKEARTEPASDEPATVEGELRTLEFKETTASEELPSSTAAPLTTASTSPDSLEEPGPAPVSPFQQPVESQISRTDSTREIGFDDFDAAREVEQLLLEEEAVRKVVEDLESHLLEVATMHTGFEKEARLRSEREGMLRAEGAVRGREAEEARRRFEEEAWKRQSEENDAVRAEQEARQRSEAELNRLAEEEKHLRMEAVKMRLAVEELSRQRALIETARREIREAATHAAATRAREEAEARHKSELAKLRTEEEALRAAVEQLALSRTEIEISRQNGQAEMARLAEERENLAAAAVARNEDAERLRNEAEAANRTAEEQLGNKLDTLRRVAEEITIRRAAVDAALEKAEREAERLGEAQARMRAEDEAREKAQAERLKLEAESIQRLETQQRLLEEARQGAEAERQRLDEELRRQTEAGERHLAELDAARKEAEIASAQRVDQEQKILWQIESLRTADAEARKRIVEAEARQRASEKAYTVTADQVLRVEAQAHARALEEAQILSKLEAARREAADAAQARAEQEKRVREEIEQFRKLEETERPRLGAAILRREEAEALLHQQTERLATEESARLTAERRLRRLVAEGSEPASKDDESVRREPEVLHAVASPERPAATPMETGVNGSPGATSEATPKQDLFADSGDFANVPPTIVSYLKSVDPYKRAAAVAELSRSGGADAFNLITKCFDDHSPHVRNAAARALGQLEPGRGVDLFNRALEEASDQRRRNIGAAIASSGVATEAVGNLDGANREETYNALCMLLIMAKTGEIQPLMRAIEEHEDEEVCRAATKILTLSGQAEMADKALKRRAGNREIVN